MSLCTVLTAAGYHERYSLIRHNLGFPPVVCCAAVGHGGSSVVTAARSSLERNVASLLQTDALLSCHIHDARGLTPRFARSGKGVHVDEVLMADEEVSTLHPDSLLATQINASASNFDVSRAPLWNVRVLRCGDRFAVVLNCHHIVADGRGMANLLEVLLSEGELPPPQLLMGVVKAMEEIPPSAEDSVPGYHLGQAGRLLVRAWSAIPPWIKGYLEGPSSWPGEKALVIHPTEAELSYHVLTLKGHEPLQTLKQQANKHGLRTIHPLFHMACVIALSSIVPDGTRIACDSPMSERVAERHTLCTGNYVSAVSVSSPLSTSTHAHPHSQHGTEMCVDGKADVWNETRSYAHQSESDTASLSMHSSLLALQCLSSVPPPGRHSVALGTTSPSRTRLLLSPLRRAPHTGRPYSMKSSKALRPIALQLACQIWAPSRACPTTSTTSFGRSCPAQWVLYLTLTSVAGEVRTARRRNQKTTTRGQQQLKLL